jgi:sorting nexin-1/2
LIRIQDVFYERVKTWQNWQLAQQNLAKKREIKARYDLAGRSDRSAAMRDELTQVGFHFILIQ